MRPNKNSLLGHGRHGQWGHLVPWTGALAPGIKGWKIDRQTPWTAFWASFRRANASNFKAFSFRRAGFTPGPRWGLRPQTTLVISYQCGSICDGYVCLLTASVIFRRSRHTDSKFFVPSLGVQMLQSFQPQPPDPLTRGSANGPRRGL